MHAGSRQSGAASQPHSQAPPQILVLRLAAAVQSIRPQADACLQSMVAVGQALMAALGEHGSAADLQALRAANEELYETRQDPACQTSLLQQLSPGSVLLACSEASPHLGKWGQLR